MAEMSGNLTVRTRLWGMVVLFVLGMAVMSAIDIRNQRSTLLSEKRVKTRHLVEAAHSLAARHAAMEIAGIVTREEAQSAALSDIQTMRYENTEYFWINDLAKPIPRMVMHPTRPVLDGKLLDDPDYNCATSLQVGKDGPVVQTDGRKNLFVAMNEVAMAGGHGYVTYRWPKPLPGGGMTSESFPKLSYVMLLPEWEWVIGTGIYTDDVDQLALDRSIGNFAYIGSIGGVLLFAATLLARSIVSPLRQSTRELAAMTQGHKPLGPLPVERQDEIGALITGFNQLQSALSEREENLRLSASVFENAREGILITDPVGRIIGVNPSFTQLTGYAMEDVIGKNPSILKSGHQGQDFYAHMWRSLTENGYWQGEIWNRRKNGEVYVEMLTITTVRNAGGQTSHYVGIFSDVTTVKEQQLRLEHMAHYDALTQLPNRTLLADRLQLALAQANRMSDILAIAFLDLDEFKPVNDRLGHDAGDQLLIEVAQRLKRCLRAGDTVARLGGDEFVLLLVGLASVQEADRTLERILESVSRPFQVKNETISIGASIGVTLYPLDGADPDLLLRHADQAMYAAKQAGRNRYHLFDLENDRRAQAHREWLSDIRSAYDARQFVLYYQPKVNLRLGRVVGAEALIRWKHPERGLITPDAFLPVIEGHELDVIIGDWVIETALAQMEAWRSDGIILPVSVNATGAQLQADDFVPKLAAALARHPELPKLSLQVEILETAALEDMDRINQVIEACAGLGVSFALDDFGTGYSSLTYFKRLPARVLKIDRSFVSDMLHEPDDRAIVEGVVGFTRAFRREVVAEGMETAAHGAMLLQLGCDVAQGYGIARPMPAEAIPDWLAAFRPDPLWQAGHTIH